MEIVFLFILALGTIATTTRISEEISKYAQVLTYRATVYDTCSAGRWKNKEIKSSTRGRNERYADETANVC